MENLNIGILRPRVLIHFIVDFKDQYKRQCFIHFGRNIRITLYKTITLWVKLNNKRSHTSLEANYMKLLICLHIYEHCKTN